MYLQDGCWMTPIRACKKVSCSMHLSLSPPGRVLMEPVNAPLIALFAKLTGGGRLLLNVCRKKLGSLSWPSMV